jgi:hypothetical protein
MTTFFSIMPAQAGIQGRKTGRGTLDPRFRGGDGHSSGAC